MEVVPIPVLSDNYAYLLGDLATKQCAAVDPVEPAKVLAAAQARGWTISHVFTTHSHWDHAGGNEEMARRLGPLVPVVAGRNDGVPACTMPVAKGDVIKIGDSVVVTVLDTPCHTPGHVCFFATNTLTEDRAVFTGDTLFVGGSGNLNSGTAEQMWHALHDVLGALPGDTSVFCGHNYTEKNLRWALHVEPTNTHVQAKLQEARDHDARKAFLPSTIAGEKLYNPFMRAAVPAIQEWAGCAGDPAATLLQVRRRKDEWGRNQ